MFKKRILIRLCCPPWFYRGVSVVIGQTPIKAMKIPGCSAETVQVVGCHDEVEERAIETSECEVEQGLQENQVEVLFVHFFLENEHRDAVQVDNYCE